MPRDVATDNTFDNIQAGIKKDRPQLRGLSDWGMGLELPRQEERSRQRNRILDPRIGVKTVRDRIEPKRVV